MGLVKLFRWLINLYTSIRSPLCLWQYKYKYKVLYVGVKYRIAGKFTVGKFGELTLFKPLAKESLVN